MTRRLRAALRSPVRPLIQALERRGVRLTLVAGTVRCRPAHLISADELATLRGHRWAVSELVRCRAAWVDWPAPIPDWPAALARGPVASPAEIDAWFRLLERENKTA